MKFITLNTCILDTKYSRFTVHCMLHMCIHIHLTIRLFQFLLFLDLRRWFCWWCVRWRLSEASTVSLQSSKGGGVGNIFTSLDVYERQ